MVNSDNEKEIKKSIKKDITGAADLEKVIKNKDRRKIS